MSGTPYAANGRMLPTPCALPSSTDLAKFQFTPTDLAGLKFWVRGDLGIHTATGVSQWDDQSGTGDSNKNLVQATGAQQPLYSASDAGFSSQPTLSFTGASSQYLQSGTWAASLPQPYTIFIVGSDSGAGNKYYSDGGANDEAAILFTGAIYEAYSGGAVTGGAFTGVAQILAVEFNGASGKLYQNALSAVGASNIGASTRTGIIVGGNHALNAFMTGKLAEVIVYNSVLSGSNFAMVMQYLGARYGITVGL